MTRAVFVAIITLAATAIPSTAVAQDTGTATVRIGTRPFTDEGTVRFTGTPGGEMVLGPGASLSAELTPGEHLSTLVSIGPTLADAGYELADIQCDDQRSAQVSGGSADYRIATFRVESGESVTCVFWLESKEAAAALSRQQREREEHTRDEHTREEHTSDEQPPDEQPPEEQPREEHTREERAREEHTRDDHTRDERPPEASEPPQPSTEERPGEEPPNSTTDCACPKEGHWKMPNLEGTFKCKGAALLNRKLKKLTKWGTTIMMKEDCSVIFADGRKKKDEEGLVSRVEGCGYEGRIEGEEQGVKVVFDVVLAIHGPEHITGEMTGTLTHTGITCDVFRPFEMNWVEPLSEAEYKRERKEGEALAELMRKKQEKQ